MKPLLSIKVTRDSRPKDWIGAEQHSGTDGLAAFAARLKAYAAVKPTAQTVVRMRRGK